MKILLSLMGKYFNISITRNPWVPNFDAKVDQKTKSDSEKIKIHVSKLTSNIKPTIIINSRNFPKNFKNN